MTDLKLSTVIGIFLKNKCKEIFEASWKLALIIIGLFVILCIMSGTAIGLGYLVTYLLHQPPVDIKGAMNTGIATMAVIACIGMICYQIPRWFYDWILDNWQLAKYEARMKSQTDHVNTGDIDS